MLGPAHASRTNVSGSEIARTRLNQASCSSHGRSRCTPWRSTAGSLTLVTASIATGKPNRSVHRAQKSVSGSTAAQGRPRAAERLPVRRVACLMAAEHPARIGRVGRGRSDTTASTDHGLQGEGSVLQFDVERVKRTTRATEPNMPWLATLSGGQGLGKQHRCCGTATVVPRDLAHPTQESGAGLPIPE